MTQHQARSCRGVGCCHKPPHHLFCGGAGCRLCRHALLDELLNVLRAVRGHPAHGNTITTCAIITTTTIISTIMIAMITPSIIR